MPNANSNRHANSLAKIALPVEGIAELQEEARAEGYNFIDTLVREWASGANRFDAPGECLLGRFDQDRVVAVGGLNVDPFAGDAKIGRIRRVYVRRRWRRRGIGHELVSALIEHAKQSFRCLRLRAENPEAARLYERLGFEPILVPDATHILRF
jgi:GNAT superfamily N-acetyltransferase